MDNNIMNIYWANLCILNRLEADEMEKKAEKWSTGHSVKPEMLYLGDTEEIQMYEKMESDIKSGRLGFDLIVSSRFDIFCSRKYLLGFKEDLAPLGKYFELTKDALSVRDPDGLFHPLVILPHYMLVNTDLVNKGDIPSSLEELLDPAWDGKVYIGSTELPSGKSVLFTVWYLYGREGLENAVKYWRHKSAPSAARFGSVKGECPVSILPGVFTGPGPVDNLKAICPSEGAPVLPSYAAVRRSEIEKEAIDFLKKSAASGDFIDMYQNRAFAVPSDPEIKVLYEKPEKMIFPPWDWILEQDMDYFDDMCMRMKI